MSLILVRTEQNYYQHGVMSFAPMFKEYAFAIDCEGELPIKTRMKLSRVLETMEGLAKEPSQYGKLVDGIVCKDISYKDGTIHIFDFKSPSLELTDTKKYQEILIDHLKEFSPVLVEEKALSFLWRVPASKSNRTEEKATIVRDVFGEIFKPQREKRLLEKSVQEIFDQKAPEKPNTKM